MNSLEYDTSGSRNFIYRFDIYLPLSDRVGEKIDIFKFTDIQELLINKFGGLTMTSMWGNPIYDGFWQSPETQKVVLERSELFRQMQ